jgi:hypothetical protein
MDGADLNRRLERAQARVACGARLVERQRCVVAKLKEVGKGSDLALTLLANFEAIQIIQVTRRDCFLRDWARVSNWPDKLAS